MLIFFFHVASLLISTSTSLPTNPNEAPFFRKIFSAERLYCLLNPCHEPIVTIRPTYSSIVEDTARNGRAQVKQVETFSPILNMEGGAQHLITDSMIGSDFPTHFQVLKVLGEGTYGKTFLVQNLLQPNERTFALKVFKGPRDLDFGGKLSSREMVVNEWKILNDKAVDLGHGPLIEDKQTGRMFLPMKFVDGERLVDRWARDFRTEKAKKNPIFSGIDWNHPQFKSEEPLTEMQNTEIIFELSKQIDKLHAAGIVHRDIAARNVILSSNLKPVIIDYGRAAYTNSEAEMVKDIAYFIAHVPRKSIDEVLKLRTLDPTLPTIGWDLFLPGHRNKAVSQTLVSQKKIK